MMYDTTAYCHKCKLRHVCVPGSDEDIEFMARHRGHHVELMPRVDPRLAKMKRMLGVDIFREIVPGIFNLWRLGYSNYGHNANVKTAYGTATAFTTTNIASLGTSATAGWKSNNYDNTTNLYDDYMINFVSASAAWTAGNFIMLFAHGLLDDSGSAYASSGDGTPDGNEGTMTFPDVTAKAVIAPVLGIVPTPVTSKAINSPPFSFAACHGGICPAKGVVGVVNNSGASFATASCNYRGVYYTVA